MHPGLRYTLLSVFCSTLLSSCFDPPPPPIAGNEIGPGVGPFDSRGNYVEDWADDPTKWRKPPSNMVASNDRPPANAIPLPREPQRPPTIRTTTPKPYVSAPKPKARTHTVQRGDTLSRIASRYRVSVSSLQRANRISGTMIRVGQRLMIPSR